MVYRLLRLFAVALLAFRQPHAPTPKTPEPPPRFLWLSSWYGPGFNGRPMASGITFWATLPVAAHKTLPLGTVVRVWHRGLSALAIVLDRGPYIRGRDLDLSEAVASQVGLLQKGVGEVIVEVVGLVPRNRWRHALVSLQAC